MSDLRDLLTSAEPWDDTGFRTAAEIRSVGARRARTARAIAAAAVLVTVCSVPYAVLRSQAAAPAVGPGAGPTSTWTSPAPTTTARGFVQTTWVVDPVASGISTDARVDLRSPQHLVSGIVLGERARLLVSIGYAGTTIEDIGTWISEGTTGIGGSGSVRFTLTKAPSDFDVTPTCTAVRCGKDVPIPYWPGVAALGRLSGVLSYEVVAPSSASAPSSARQEMRLLDAAGRTLLVLYRFDG